MPPRLPRMPREQGWQATSVAYAAKRKGREEVPANPPAEPAASKAASGEIRGRPARFAGRQCRHEAGHGRQGDCRSPRTSWPRRRLALGPEIAGRILGARPLWSDEDAQRRVNLVGRWVAVQTSRPGLPWTFGVIDTPEVNAFAAPGGFILITRGLYELLSSDSELAAVLGHEISHCVQRDHYNVIHKQEMAATGKDLAMQDVRRRQ